MKSEIILLTIAMILLNIDSCCCAGTILSDADCNVHMRATSVTPSVYSLHWVAHQLSSFCRTFYKMKVTCQSINSCKKLVPSSNDTNRRHTVVHYYPLIGETGLLTGLHPNTLYNCSAQLQKTSRKLEPSQSFTVQTGVGAPERPLKPNIHKKDENTLIIKIHNSSTCNGPISGYEVQFHVVDTISLDEDNLPLIPEDQLKPLNGNLASLEEARNNKKASSFYIRERVIHDITINTRSLMNGALKVNSTYVIITSVYTHVQDQELLYSYSLPSDPMTFKTDEVPTKESNEDESFSERYGERLLYVTAGASPFGVILCMFALICLIWRIRSNRLKNKRNKIYMYEPLKLSAVSERNLHNHQSSTYFTIPGSPDLVSPYFSHSPYPPTHIEPPRSPRPSSQRRTPLHNLLYYQLNNGNDGNESAGISISSRPQFVPPLKLTPLIDQSLTSIPPIDKSLTSVPPVDQSLTSVPPVDQSLTSVPQVDQSLTSVLPVDQSLTSIPPVDKSLTSVPQVDQSLTIVPPVDQSLTSVPPVDQSLTSVPPIDQSLTSVLPVNHSLTRVLQVDHSLTNIPPVDQSFTNVPPVDHSLTSVPPVDHLLTSVPPVDQSITNVPPVDHLLTSVSSVDHSLTSVSQMNHSLTSVIPVDHLLTSIQSIGHSLTSVLPVNHSLTSLSPLGPMSPTIQPLLQSPISPTPPVAANKPPPLPHIMVHRSHPPLIKSYSSPVIIPSTQPPPITQPPSLATPPPLITTPSSLLTAPPPLVTTPSSLLTTPPTLLTTPSSLLTTPALFSSLSGGDSGLIDQAPDLEMQFSELNLYPCSRNISPLQIPDSTHLIHPQDDSSISSSSSYYLAPEIPHEYSSAYVTANTSPAESFFLAPEEPFIKPKEPQEISEEVGVAYSPITESLPSAMNVLEFMTPPMSPWQPKNTLQLLVSDEYYKSCNGFEDKAKCINDEVIECSDDGERKGFYSIYNIESDYSLDCNASNAGIINEAPVIKGDIINNGGCDEVEGNNSKRNGSFIINVKALERLINVERSSSSSLEKIN